MHRWIQKLTVVLATGYILFFYSERVFWSFVRPGDKPLDFVLGWLVYSAMAWMFLLLVRQCRIASFPAVFLAGAVYGWLDEGVVVDTLYGNADNPFPASISFTGLAWHALISVGIGWYGQAKILVAGKPARTALFSAAVGLGWGLWAAWWPAELGRANTSLAAFVGHTLVCSVLLIVAWMIYGTASSEWFRPAKYELVVLLAIVALFFFAVRLPATPRSALILPPLVLLCAYGLRRNRSQEERPDLIESTVGHIDLRSCWVLLLMPASAVMVYTPIAVWQLTLPTNWVLYMITMPLGFGCLIASIWLILRGRSSSLSSR
ncbi:MAG: hypothetical protein AB9869_17950 [Verrucomicrobiia bacterium]